MPIIFNSNYEWRGILFVTLSGMLFGVMGFLGTKITTYHFTIVNMLFWRFLVATIWIVAFTYLFNKKVWQDLSKNYLNKKYFGKIFIISSLSYSGSSIFYFFASHYIGTGLAMVVFFSFPVFVTIFACVLDKWPLNKFIFFSLLFVVSGLLLLKTRSDAQLNYLGITFAVVSALSYAVYVYTNQHYSKSIPTNVLTIAVCLGNTLLFLMWSLYEHSFHVPLTLTTWGYVIAIGILATALPIQFLLYGLKYISSIKASILSVLEPVVTVLIGMLLLNETITFTQAIGIIVIILGAIIIQFEKLPSIKTIKVYS